MNHDRAAQLLIDYCLGRLKGRTKQAIEQHINQCPICERELQRLQQAEQLLRAAGLLRPSNPNRLLDRVRFSVRQPVAVAPSRHSWRWATALAAGIAAVLIVVMAWVWWRPVERQNPSVSYEELHALLSWDNPISVVATAVPFDVQEGEKP